MVLAQWSNNSGTKDKVNIASVSSNSKAVFQKVALTSQQDYQIRKPCVD